MDDCSLLFSEKAIVQIFIGYFLFFRGFKYKENIVKLAIAQIGVTDTTKETEFA